MFAARNLFLTASAAIKDAYFKYVTMLLPGNGTNGKQNNTFLDSSTNNFTITRNGNTTQGTFSPYGSNWSNYFDGSGDSLTVANNAALYFGTGDFTIECWICTSATVSYQTIASVYGSPTSNNGWYFCLSSAGTGLYLSVFDGSTGTALEAGSGLNNGAWHHVAAVRTGTTLSTYIDGARIATTTNSFNITATANLQISGYSTLSRDWNGYISNFRIIKGSGPYNASSSTLTVPTSPLTAITNTSLLTCQSNRFIDNSSNAFTITRNGDTSVQRFSPFSPTLAYTASTIGGSGYFDGNGDWLSFPDSAAFDIGLSNNPFTIELWYYPLSLGDAILFGRGGGFAGWNSTTGWQYVIFPYTSSTSFYIQYWSGSALVNVTGAPPASYGTNRWNHIAVSYNGTSTAIFINGTRIATGATGYGKPSSSNITQVGKSVVSAETNYANGYISDVRVVKGTAVYDPTLSTCTVPTAPLTAITNTSLLTNFTNAGIIDNAMMNDAETVGNAQISTAQSKFGGGSMYFDGTGDTLATLNTPNIRLGSGNFTIEMWVYFNAVSGNPYLMMCGNAGATTGFYWYLNGSNSRWELYVGSSAQTLQAASAPSTGQWYHVALVRNGSALTMYVNGSSVASATNSSWTDETTNPFYVGSSLGTGYWLNGYIDDLRITKGYARYTANFTAPTAPFPTS